MEMGRQDQEIREWQRTLDVVNHFVSVHDSDGKFEGYTVQDRFGEDDKTPRTFAEKQKAQQAITDIAERYSKAKQAENESTEDNGQSS